MCIRDSGFLGGAAPAVKGLSDIQFSQPSSTIIEFEIEEPPNENSLELDLEHKPNSFDLIQSQLNSINETIKPVSYTHLRAHETVLDLVCRLLLEKKKTSKKNTLS